MKKNQTEEILQEQFEVSDEEANQKYFDFVNDINADFVLKADATAAENWGIHPGDYLFVKQVDDPLLFSNGAIVAILRDSGFAAYRWSYDPKHDCALLTTSNPKSEPIYLDGDEIFDFGIVGVVTVIMHFCNALIKNDVQTNGAEDKPTL